MNPEGIISPFAFGSISRFANINPTIFIPCVVLPELRQKDGDGPPVLALAALSVRPQIALQLYLPHVPERNMAASLDTCRVLQMAHADWQVAERKADVEPVFRRELPPARHRPDGWGQRQIADTARHPVSLGSSIAMSIAFGAPGTDRKDGCPCDDRLVVGRSDEGGERIRRIG